MRGKEAVLFFREDFSGGSGFYWVVVGKLNVGNCKQIM